MKAFALWHVNTEKSELREESLASGDHSIILESLYSFVSQGTETTIALGNAKGFEENMSVPYMQGNFSLPCKYGYSLVAKLIKGPSEMLGHRFHLMHPHQSMVAVEFQSLSEVPEQVPSKRATLKSNLETVINAIWDGDAIEHQDILIIGGGNIGVLLAFTLKLIYNKKVVVCEKEESRRKWIKNVGLELIEELPKSKFSLVYHSTGSKNGLQQAIDSASFEGSIVELSWYGNKTVELQLGGSFHYDRKRIISSQVGTIPKKMKDMDYKKRTSIIWEWLLRPEYDQLIDEVIAFEDSPLFFDQIRHSTPANPITLLSY